MFCILEIKDLFKSNPPFYAVKTVIPKTAVFESLTAFSYSGKCDFHAVREHLKSFSKSVIFAENCDLPASSGIFEFSSNELRARMTLNTALLLLESVRNRHNISLTLADKTGVFSDYLIDFVPFAKRVNVITDNLLRYRYASLDVLENYGAVVSAGEWSGAIPDSDVFVSVSQSGFSPMSVAVKNRTRNSYISLVGDGFTLPEKYEKYRKENIPNYAFASALYTLSSVKELGEMKYDSFTVNGRSISLDCAVKMLDTLLIV